MDCQKFVRTHTREARKETMQLAKLSMLKQQKKSPAPWLQQRYTEPKAREETFSLEHYKFWASKNLWMVYALCACKAASAFVQQGQNIHISKWVHQIQDITIFLQLLFFCLTTPVSYHTAKWVHGYLTTFVAYLWWGLHWACNVLKRCLCQLLIMFCNVLVVALYAICCFSWSIWDGFELTTWRLLKFLQLAAPPVSTLKNQGHIFQNSRIRTFHPEAAALFLVLALDTLVVANMAAAVIFLELTVSEPIKTCIQTICVSFERWCMSILWKSVTIGCLVCWLITRRQRTVWWIDLCSKLSGLPLVLPQRPHLLRNFTVAVVVALFCWNIHLWIDCSNAYTAVVAFIHSTNLQEHVKQIPSYWCYAAQIVSDWWYANETTSPPAPPPTPPAPPPTPTPPSPENCNHQQYANTSGTQQSSFEKYAFHGKFRKKHDTANFSGNGINASNSTTSNSTHKHTSNGNCDNQATSRWYPCTNKH